MPSKPTTDVINMLKETQNTITAGDAGEDDDDVWPVAEGPSGESLNSIVASTPAKPPPSQVSNGVSTSVASTPKPSTEAGGLPTPPPSASSSSRNKKPSQKDRQSFHDSFASFLSSDWEQKREENIKPDLEVSLYIIRRLTGWVLIVSTGF